MKILVLLFALLVAFGFAIKDTVGLKATEKEIATAQVAEEVESPVMNILLDTVEIVVSSQNVIAGL